VGAMKVADRTKQHCRCRGSAQAVTITVTCLVIMRHMWQARTISGLILDSDRQIMAPYLLRMKLWALFHFCVNFFQFAAAGTGQGSLEENAFSRQPQDCTQ